MQTLTEMSIKISIRVHTILSYTLFQDNDQMKYTEQHWRETRSTRSLLTPRHVEMSLTVWTRPSWRDTVRYWVCMNSCIWPSWRDTVRLRESFICIDVGYGNSTPRVSISGQGRGLPEILTRGWNFHIPHQYNMKDYFSHITNIKILGFNLWRRENA
jgi:hypothetical protein